jgi:16S rRNA (cytidine1402-2'-O)-methyltransferase
MPEQKPASRRYVIGTHVFEAEPIAAGLYVTATPIGNLRDITIRALETLAAADRICCEDTRTTATLLKRYGIRTALSPYHEHNAEKMRPEILDSLGEGQAVALVSDAGTPLVSDPGYKLVRDVLAAGYKVEAIPGASALLTGLVLSGLPSDRFLFGGFLSSKTGERRTQIEELAQPRATLILFESPHRIVDTLTAIAEAMGDPQVAVTRELTKLHEEVLRGKASVLAEELAARPAIKGEITLFVGASEKSQHQATAQDIDAALLAAAQSKPASQAAADVARELGLSRKALYQRLVSLKAGQT